MILKWKQVPTVQTLPLTLRMIRRHHGIETPGMKPVLETGVLKSVHSWAHTARTYCQALTKSAIWPGQAQCRLQTRDWVAVKLSRAQFEHVCFVRTEEYELRTKLYYV